MKENYGLLKVEPPAPTVFQNLLQRRQDDVQRMRGLQPASSVSEAANSVSRNLFTEVAKSSKNSVSNEAPVKPVTEVPTSDKSIEKPKNIVSIVVPVKPVKEVGKSDKSIEDSKPVKEVAISSKSIDRKNYSVSVEAKSIGRQKDSVIVKHVFPAKSIRSKKYSVSVEALLKPVTEIAIPAKSFESKKNSVSFEAPVKQVQKVATSDKSTEESWVSISIEAPVKPVTAAVMPEISIESSKNSVNDVAIPPKSVEGPMDIVSVKVLRHPVVASQNDRKVDLGSGDCHLLMLVNKLKKVLDSTWDCVQEDLAEDPSAQPNIWVSRWMHLNKKYGFAYWLSDDSIGILLPGWSFSRMATPFATLIPTAGSRASRCATTRSRWG